MQRVPTVLVVKTGYPLAARVQAYRTFYRLGWRVAVVDEPLNQGIGIADVPIVSDLHNVERLCDLVWRRIGRPDAILTLNDSGLLSAAMVAENFGLPHISSEVAVLATDKERQRELMQRSGVRVPRWQRAKNTDDIELWRRRFGDVVVKPVDRSASAGVTKVSAPAGSESAFDTAMNESGAGRVLVEEYIEGPEFSVESVAIDGAQVSVAVTRKLIGHSPQFLELGHSVPADLPTHLIAEIEQLAMEATHALGVDLGVCHTEVKLTEQGPVLIEVNARPAGDRICDLLHLALGVDLYRLLLEQAAGEVLTAADLAPRDRKSVV